MWNDRFYSAKWDLEKRRKHIESDNYRISEREKCLGTQKMLFWMDWGVDYIDKHEAS